MHVCLHAQPLSRVRLFATPQAVARQAPLSLGPPRQEYWRGLPFSTPGDLPDPGIEPSSPMLPALAGGFFITEPPGKSPLKKKNNFFLLKDNCFIEFCGLLSNLNMNQPQVPPNCFPLKYSRSFPYAVPIPLNPLLILHSFSWLSYFLSHYCSNNISFGKLSRFPRFGNLCPQRARNLLLTF